MLLQIFFYCNGKHETNLLKNANPYMKIENPVLLEFICFGVIINKQYFRLYSFVCCTVFSKKFNSSLFEYKYFYVFSSILACSTYATLVVACAMCIQNRSSCGIVGSTLSVHSLHVHLEKTAFNVDFQVIPKANSYTYSIHRKKKKYRYRYKVQKLYGCRSVLIYSSQFEYMGFMCCSIVHQQSRKEIIKNYNKNHNFPYATLDVNLNGIHLKLYIHNFTFYTKNK